MSLLEAIGKPEKRPLIGTVIGEAGVGKNSFAATFSKPIFIRAEDGVGRQSSKVETPDAFPVVRKADDVFQQLLALLNEDHAYETLVVDSTTALDTIFTNDILEKDNAKTLARALGGYGAGYDMLASMHGRVRKAAGLLNQRKNMTVWFLAHAALEEMRLPDKDDYLRYSLRLSKKALTFFIDDVDLVGHIRLQSALRGDDEERKRIISNGDREFVCYSTASSVTKNGLGIVSALDFEEGTNPLAPYLDAVAEKPRRTRKPKEEEVDEVPDGDV